MSTTNSRDYNKPSYRRDDSGELDVFEAASYFSNYNDDNALVGAQEMVTKENKLHGYSRQRRASLDIPSLKQQQLSKHYNQNYTITTQQSPRQQLLKEKKKHKQPSSPGGKLAHFLNSLFNQAIMTSKKNKLPKSTLSMKAEDESPSGRRRRRSSMSNFWPTASTLDAKPFNSSANSGFRTPPPHHTRSTTAKTYQNVKSFYHYKQVLPTLSKNKIHDNGLANLKDVKIRGAILDCIDDKTKANKTGFVEKPKDHNYNHGNYQEKKRETKKFEDVDDGEESDESCDLFELKLDHDIGFSSNGLPVFETTDMGNIKRPPITALTNGTFKH